MLAPYITENSAKVAGELNEICKRFDGATVLITGALGFLGQYFLGFFTHINERLLNNPCRVLAYDNLITAEVTNQGTEPALPNVIFRVQDVTTPLIVEEDVDYVIHAAGIASPFYYQKYPLETLDVAVTGTRNLLELAREKRARGVLFFSSSEIYGDPDAKHVPTSESYAGHVSCTGSRACYDESKRLGETLCVIFHKLHGIPTKVVRPFNVYGPGMKETDYRVLPNFGSLIVGGKPLNIYGTGKQTRTFCYITDALEGFLRVLLDGVPGEAYNIGNPKPEISVLDLVSLLEETLGRTIPSNLIEYPDSYPADEPQRRCPNIIKAVRQCGYHPKIDLPAGLRYFMDWAKINYTGVHS